MASVVQRQKTTSQNRASPQRQSPRNNASPKRQGTKKAAQAPQGNKHDQIQFKGGERYEGPSNLHRQMHTEEGEQGRLDFPGEVATYIGQFSNGQLTTGRLTYNDDQSYFEGSFGPGMKWGTGVFTKGDTSYEGTFQDQEITGPNFTITWSEVAKYVGGCKGGKLHGEGVLTFENEPIRSINGRWDDGNLVECKLLTNREGSTANNYVPQRGCLFGQGLVKVDQCIFKGIWDESGVMSDTQAEILHERPEGQAPFTVFKGEVRNNVPHGRGEYFWQGQTEDTNSKYTGSFVNGLRDTSETGEKATMTWNGTQSTYIGTFKEGSCLVGHLNQVPVDQSKAASDQAKTQAD